MITIEEVQSRLNSLGYDAGPVDGVRGRRTIRAVRDFQSDFGLHPDGLVGPDTARALFGDAVTIDQVPDARPWFDLAGRMMGLHEQVHRRRLSEFLASDGGSAGDPGLTPWCADFVQTCIALSLPEEPLPTNPYLAANWVRFGRPVDPCPGAVLVFWRDSPDSWKGHVGFCVDVDADNYLVRGGNQDDRVSDIPINAEFLREGGSRWPVSGLRFVAQDAGGLVAD